MTQLATAAGSPAIFPLAVSPGSGGSMGLAMTDEERRAKSRESGRRYREKHREKYRKLRREAWRRYKARHPERVREQNRESSKRYRRSQRQADPVGYSARRLASQRPVAKKAHKALDMAVRAGKVERESCECCGREPTDGHHDDYSRPLDVRWLCRSCHQLLHSSRREQKERVTAPPPPD